MGIDLGGTKIEGVILAGSPDTFEILARRRVPTEAAGGYNHIVDRVTGFIRQLADEFELATPIPVGVGMPGSLTRDGRVKNSNTVCLNGTQFRKDVSQVLGQPLPFANDANCFALAEATMGAGNGYALVFGVIMGTGVGGGIVYQGTLWEGGQSLAGEWGHMILWPNSDQECYCGQRGCVETYLAGPCVEKRYREATSTSCTLATIIEKYSRREQPATEHVSNWLDNYGRALANVINVLDPDIIVLGGGLSNAAPLYDEGRAAVARYVFNNELLTPIVPNQLGDSAGVLGAALLVS